MLLVHKFFIPFIPNENHIGACKFLSYFKYIVCNGNDSQQEMYNVHRAHRRTNKLTDVYSCKSFVAVGNKACVRWVRVCVCVCVCTIHSEGTNRVNDHAISNFGILRAEFSFHMIRSDGSSSNCTIDRCDVCCMLQTSYASHWLFAHPYINM